MKKLQFSVDIKAPKERVWKVLWDDSNYKQWTSVFSEGSHAVTDWKEGSKVQFLSGTGEGMFSQLAKKKPNEFMSFNDLGVIKDGKEQPTDEKTKEWSGVANCEMEECMPEVKEFRDLVMEPINALLKNGGKGDVVPCLKYHTFWSIIHGLISIKMMSTSDVSDELNKLVLDDAIEGFIKNLKR